MQVLTGGDVVPGSAGFIVICVLVMDGVGDPLAKPIRYGVAAFVVHDSPQLHLETEHLEARRAFVEVCLDLVAAGFGQLTVKEVVDAV